jgi:antitoxin (DNA-binding transcriptional repressor) of toxin-antitoxin stability system
MKSRVSATHAVRHFSDLLNRVRYHGEEFIIERRGEPMCTISPLKPSTCTMAELVAFLRSLPKPDPGFWDAVEEATTHYTEMPESPWER